MGNEIIASSLNKVKHSSKNIAKIAAISKHTLCCMFLSSEKHIKTSQLHSLTDSFLSIRMNILLCQRKSIVFAIKKKALSEKIPLSCVKQSYC